MYSRKGGGGGEGKGKGLFIQIAYVKYVFNYFYNLKNWKDFLHNLQIDDTMALCKMAVMSNVTEIFKKVSLCGKRKR